MPISVFPIKAEVARIPGYTDCNNRMIPFFVCLFICFIETGFLYIVLSVLELKQAGLTLGNLPASASQMLVLKVYATTIQFALITGILHNHPYFHTIKLASSLMIHIFYSFIWFECAPHA